MKTAILEKQLQKFSDAFSEFDDVFKNAEMNFVSSPNAIDISRERLLAEIDNDLSDIDERVYRIGEKVEQLKRCEGIL